MRCRVRLMDSFHWAALIRRTRPERMAATNTPVPAAESQLMVNLAASGFAPGRAMGGIRCTRLCRCGISHAGRDSVPPNGEPRMVVLNFTPEKRLFRPALKVGMPQIAQQAMRIAQGS